ncbi:MAG: class I SAM-dependent methyltransferase [Nitrososphaerales archaeon]
MDPQKACPANCELFGRFADRFESQVVPLWQEVYDSLVTRAWTMPGSKVLDVGTGTGEVALRMGRVAGPTGRVVAIDTEKEMLEIGRRKAKEMGAGNVRFRQMDVERLDLPDNHFDSVVGNYSICCVLNYERALTECLRVLKPGGMLTFNQSGLRDPDEFVVAFGIFEKYQTKAPSNNLKGIREARAMQKDAVEVYRTPEVTLDLMKKLGYAKAQATTTERVIRYKDAGAFLDRLLLFNWRSEAEEISGPDLSRFRSEAATALAPLSKGPQFLVRDDMVFFTGLKPHADSRSRPALRSPSIYRSRL